MFWLKMMPPRKGWHPFFGHLTDFLFRASQTKALNGTTQKTIHHIISVKPALTKASFRCKL
ncbi:MAG: hypothetical protein COW03_00485 [Cytophagales bacterium CG12_big_fil_rev_8_21_14_0_65_40_12]|nr:MAG: hypothetical protein COW03_00485 [Cytophagales bacterium CG12_big_fil_rev_8_21_14_0_65_40_12]PIW04580.1 MAG: hypothetical protein COW40_09265 [Cytophagales bacterium CG17_big_fil_post_rev_8_21_14_2_50_40_13]